MRPPYACPLVRPCNTINLPITPNIVIIQPLYLFIVSENIYFIKMKILNFTFTKNDLPSNCKKTYNEFCILRVMRRLISDSDMQGAN